MPAHAALFPAAQLFVGQPVLSRPGCPLRSRPSYTHAPAQAALALHRPSCIDTGLSRLNLFSPLTRSKLHEPFPAQTALVLSRPSYTHALRPSSSNPLPNVLTFSRPSCTCHFPQAALAVTTKLHWPFIDQIALVLSCACSPGLSRPSYTSALRPSSSSPFPPKLY